MLNQLLAAVQPQITALAGKDVLVAHCAPVQHSHELPWEPVLSTCRSRCQQTSVALHGLLEGEPCLEGYVADGKADPPVFRQHGQVSFMQYFGGAASSMDHQHEFRQAGIS
mgnify:CR=1 FL=1